MNETSTTQDTAAAPLPQRSMATSTESFNTTPNHKMHREGGANFSEELAKKVMRLTGGIRLTSRSAQGWHHCGINE